MRKFTSMMLMLLCAVTTWAAEVTDLPEMSTDGNIKWYTIKNTRSANGGYLYYTASGVKDTDTSTAASLFYFTGTSGACKIHNCTTGLLFTGAGAWNESGVDCALTVSPLNTGVMIGFNSTFLNEQNHADGYTTWGDVNDDGSIFVIEPVTDFTSIIDVPAAKTAAIEKLNTLATVSTLYPSVAEAVADVQAVEAAGTGPYELYAAIENIDAIVAGYIKSTFDGKYYSIHTPARDNVSKGYLEMSTSKVVGKGSVATPAAIWQFVENNGKVNIYNPYTGKYLCEPQGNSAVVAVTTNQATAGAYDLAVNASAANDAAKIKLTSNGKSAHMDGDGNLVRWDNGGASEYTVLEMSEADINSLVTPYKATTIATLDQWATLSVVFDANLIATAKEAVNAVEANGMSTFAEIDSKLTDVTDAVAAKMFTFQTLATDNHRENVWVSANATTGKAIGAHIAEADYNSIWSLRHAGGSSFYMFNELNQKYMGNPGGNCALSDTPSAAYTFEIVDAANGVVEMKCGGETMHASNHDDDKLLNWDGDQPASRWYIRTINIAAEIEAILNGLTADDYAEVPALGQYTTAAYNELVAARTSAKTVAEVEAAIVAFNKAKNRPVFTISGTKDYVVGKSLYEDEGNTNAKGNDCYFKTTNKYDKTMWWVFDQTATTVGVTESVAVVNYATGNPIWGVENLKITETNPEIADDGVFLFYTVGNDTPLHFQSDGSLLTRWSSHDAASGSAATFTYVGNTYDLDKLTPEKIAALSALQATYNNKADLANAEIGEGLGKYSAGNIDAIVAAEAAAKNILNSAAVQATLEISAINAAANALNDAAATLVINMPAPGKYYRIQGACEASLAGYYITGHTNADGGRIALTDVADASTIYYFDGTNLIAYQSGLVVGLNATHWTFASIENNNNPASTIKFAQSPRTAGAYTVKSADRYFHYTVYNNTVQVNRCSSDDCKEHDWYLTEVTELPVTISAAKWASFYAPVAVTLPEGVKAYYAASINEKDQVQMTEIEGTIPANTGVMLNGGAANYDFAIAESATAIEGENMFKGTVATTQMAEENTTYYLLSMQNGVVGLYPHGTEHGNFQNNSHKAYLPVTTTEAALSYGFTFGGTTAIEGIEAVAGEQAIYDLTGRKIEAITVPGLYIINGVKTIVE